MFPILICPNAFKGSLTAVEAAEAIRAGIERGAASIGATGGRFVDQITTDLLPLADGGDGTLQTLVAATGGRIIPLRVPGPLGRPVDAAWGRLGGAWGGTGVIEMALASGLALLRSDERDPMRASTYGTGVLIRAALEQGCEQVVVGIGGSATNDGGAGMATALGARLLDAHGRELSPGGAALANLARIDLDGMKSLSSVDILIASDVDNPLCGPEGASAVYGPQKGATPEMVTELDAALARYATVLREQLGLDVASKPGAGAAGGLGAGLMAFCGAKLRSGLEIATEVTGFDARLARCSLAITGEGRIDGQTARGKVVAGVARRAAAAGVPVVALAGAIEPGAEAQLRPLGLTSVLPIPDRPMSVDEAMRDAAGLLAAAAERLIRLISVRVR
ncbi:MAG TPA: glycerate kinase [Chthonomonadaceae bacterium]|nr:glycerate kinase [Chthonomonadaceae bacterium]